ncbi:MAG: class E sortase, partial [Microthrixaceae bacterium]|nr:class E sortase [Microthrixaceae bacterium]
MRRPGRRVGDDGDLDDETDPDDAGAQLRRTRVVPVALWALAVVVGVVIGAVVVQRLLPEDAGNLSSAVVPVPGDDETGGRAETAEVLLPAGTPTGDDAVPSAGRPDARLRVDALDLDVPVVEGVDLGSLSHGVGHWPGTAGPGEVGNMVIAGHRTTHGAPFRRLDELAVGDEVTIGVADRDVVYRVTGTEIVDPDDVEVARPTDDATATLFAC